MFILFIFTFNTLHSKHITQARISKHKVSHPVFWPFSNTVFPFMFMTILNTWCWWRECITSNFVASYATYALKHMPRWQANTQKNLAATSWISLVWPEPCTWRQRWNKQVWCMKTHVTELHLLETIRTHWLTVCCGWKTLGLVFHTRTHKVYTRTFSKVSTKQGIRIWMGLDLRS
jgi:hypothetical protein